MAVLIIGGVAFAALAIARMIYEPSIQQREESARLALATQHAQVCDQLGKPAGAPDRDNCLNLLDKPLYASSTSVHRRQQRNLAGRQLHTSCRAGVLHN